MYLLDTDHISLMQDAGDSGDSVRAKCLACPPEQLFISVISLQEQTAGWNAYLNKARKAHEFILGYAMLQRLIFDYATPQLIPFDSNAQTRFESLKLLKLRIGTLDLRIGSIGLARKLTVVTRNLRDFRQIPGLLIQDWSA